MQTNRITKHIDRLLVDPNNYRFIDKSEYQVVTEDKVADERVQQRTLNLLRGKSNENISDLVASFKTNGFLDIDQIRVKQVDANYYLVLEGNRRVAALKYLYEIYKQGFDVGELNEQAFRSIPLVQIIDEDPVHHLITMGLHHISGKKRWSPINQAQLVEDLITKYGKTENEICDALGISKHILRRSTRTLALIKQYKDSDFGDQFETNMYSLFEEVIKNQKMKEWISWDDDEYHAYNDKNLNRFFSWISKTEEVERIDENDEEYRTLEPIISKSHEIRELSEYVFDEKALNKMEESRSISEGFTFSDAIGKNRLQRAISNIKSETQVAFNFSEFINDSEYQEIIKLKDKLERLIPRNDGTINIGDKTPLPYFNIVKNHFTTSTISSYKRLKDISIKKIGRINLFAGDNNAGKTSILEVFYLLSQLNDLNAFLELEKFRGKFYNDFSAKWIDRNFVGGININGTFNESFSSVQIQKQYTEENIDKTNYLSTIKLDAQINNVDLSSSIHLYSDREPELKYSRSQIICQAAFTSPYRYNGNLLKKAHAHAVEARYFDEVVDFIKSSLDSSIEKIELVSDGKESRFMITSRKFDNAINITNYGEGLQRIFEIALLMSYCRNGILCIDEVDSAIHKRLLIDFTRFIQISADRFNVQVFMSTHSKECIDAFIENGYPDDDLTAYALKEENGLITCKFLEGNKLKRLVETIDLDIR